jgi:glycosyltransferase involved in cell wall biosynthesis
VRDDARAPTLLAAGTYDADAHPRVRVLLEGMAARGWAVDEVVEPLGLDTARRVAVLRHAAGVPGLVLAIGRAWWRLVPRLRRRLRAGPPPDAVLVAHLGHFDVGLVRLLVRPAPVVLDHLVSGAGTAADRGVEGPVKRRLLAALDRFAVALADVVVVDTAERLDELAPRGRARAVVVPVGADERWFVAGAATPHGRAPGPLSVVFFGSFTPLQGTTTIARALRLLDGAVAATLVGGGQDEAAVDALLRGVPGVRRLPWVASDELPALVARHDVCLGIVGTSDKALRVVPTKVFQGAAAGCAIVTGDTPPQRRALGEAAVLVPVGDPAALADALRALAADDERLAWLRAAARSRAEEAFTPARVVADLDARLRPRPGPVAP